MSKALLTAIDKLKKKVEAVPAMVEESCVDIASRANSAAPIGISVQAIGNTVVAKGPLGNESMAAYYEFGTGAAAARYTPSLPQNWDDYAEKVFYKTGEGTLGESPYLFPAYEVERVALIKKIKDSFK